MQNYNFQPDTGPEEEKRATPPETPIPEKREGEQAPERTPEKPVEGPRPVEEQKPTGGPPPQMPTDEEEEEAREPEGQPPPPPSEGEVIANIAKELAKIIPKGTPEEEEAANGVEKQENRDVLAQP